MDLHLLLVAVLLMPGQPRWHPSGREQLNTMADGECEKPLGEHPDAAL